MKLATLKAKAIATLILLLALAGGTVWLHHSAFADGQADTQATWDAATVKQDAITQRAQAANAAQTLDWLNKFSAIGAKFEASTHAQAPQVADSVAAGVGDGSIRLRDAVECQVPAGYVPVATARARVADAAATQALADRTAHAMAAVRAGDEADARERELDALVIALRGLLQAERETH